MPSVAECEILTDMNCTLLVFGDVVGKIGRSALMAALPKLKSKFKPDLVLVNAENLAHGRGITPRIILDLESAGVDAFTSGHHVWENQTGLQMLNDPAHHIVRPANVDPALDGVGYLRLPIHDREIVILNLQGQLFMSQVTSSPFLAFDRCWAELTNKTKTRPVVILDFHAEATSEKLALANYIDGRAAAVYGTHTHVPTADEKILPNGTAYQTDVGMCGALDSVIGFEINSSIKRFLQQTEAPYLLTEKGLAEVNGLIITIDMDTGKTLHLDRIREIVDI